MSTAGKATAVLALLIATSAMVSSGAARADTTIVEEKRTTIAPARIAIAPMGAMRSDYDKRLNDMLDQIQLGLQKGWLSQGQADYLRQWNSDVKHEVAVFRSAGGGIEPSVTVNQLERHVNSLAWLINRQIGEGSRSFTAP